MICTVWTFHAFHPKGFDPIPVWCQCLLAGLSILILRDWHQQNHKKQFIHTVTYKAENQKEFTGSKIGAIFGKITSRVTTINLKVGQRGLFELGPFFSLFLMRKTLSSGQKWFLRPYFPLIRGMFVFRTKSEENAILVSENGLFLTLFTCGKVLTFVNLIIVKKDIGQITLIYLLRLKYHSHSHHQYYCSQL